MEKGRTENKENIQSGRMERRKKMYDKKERYKIFRKTDKRIR